MLRATGWAMAAAILCSVVPTLPVRAAEPLSPAQSCDALAAAFNIVAAQSKGTNLDKAKALSAEGVGDCKNNKHKSGIDKLHEALFIVTRPH
jgi:hypothetical protein